jgi:hypothetical protein
MPDNSTADHLNTEALYMQVLRLVGDVVYDMERGKETYNEDDLLRALDPILAMGKIIGRRDALKDQPRMPVAGEIWRSITAPGCSVEISGEQNWVITYRHMHCSTRACPAMRMGRPCSRPQPSFLRLYEPTTPAYDRLIEDWTKIVEADIR